jgi:DNA-binding transcriptional regulator YiaG
MTNDTTKQNPRKNISDFLFSIIEAEEEVSPAVITGIADDAGARARGPLGVTERVTARAGVSPGRSPGDKRSARLQALIACIPEIERKRKRRQPATLTPKGQFGGPTRHKPSFLDEVAAIPEPTAQDFRDLRRLALNLSREQCGKLFRLHKGTVEHWEYGRTRIPFSAYLVLHLLRESDRSRSLSVAREREASKPRQSEKDFGSGVAEYLPRSEAAPASHPVPLDQQGRYVSHRERVGLLRQRMARFSSIYNAAWSMRQEAFGPEGKKRAAEKLAAVLMRELWDCNDCEALICAVAHAQLDERFGFPWEV